MQKVLLVEDSRDFRLVVSETLKNRYQLKCVETIALARIELSTNEFSLIILDVNLPDGNGFEFCSELQSSEVYSSIPVVILTGRKEISDKVLGWKTGAVDYIEKPFHPFEFQARIEAHIRKQVDRLVKDEFLVKGKLKLDIAFHEAKIIEAGIERNISLTRNEFRLLRHLVVNQDRVLSRRQLQEAVWGSSTHITDRNVDKHISSLRQKLEAESHYIKTISGLGYKFSLPKAS